MPPVPENNNSSSLERLRNKLYSNEQPQRFDIENVAHEVAPAPTAWEAPPPPKPKGKYSLSLIFLIGASVFFVLAAVVAVLLLVFGGRAVSTKNVIVDISGPVAIGSGDAVSLQITLKNEDPAIMLAPQLTVDLPESARSADEPTKPAERYLDTLPDLEPGVSIDRTVRAVFFGNENEKIVLPVRVEYRTPGSNAVFVKEATYEFVITSSPVTLSVETLSQTSSGQELMIAVRLRSNAKVPLEQVALLPSYPTGFVKTEQPIPSNGPLIPIGTLQPGEEKILTVRGTLSGEDGDQRYFRFTAGTRKDDVSANLAVSYTSAEAGVVLAKPFLATTLSVNRDTSNAPVVEAGTSIPAIVSWINTLQTPITDAQITVKLGGEALDPSSVRTSGGYYRSSDNTIIFNRETDPTLASLGSGDTGNSSFTFETKTGNQLSSLRNPVVTITVSAAGRRVGESNVPETITSTMTRTIKVGTNFALGAGAERVSGPFPPQVGKETVYTVSWKLANTVNSIGDVKVTATLPSYVRYAGSVTPAGTNLAYNDTTRTLTWNAGDVAANGSGKEISFQIALLPTDSQRGTSPILVSGQVFSGYDLFTRTPVSGSRADLIEEEGVTN